MPNKSDTIVARLARGAATSGVVIGSVALNAGEMASVGVQFHAVGAASSVVESIAKPKQENAAATDNVIEYKVVNQPNEWTKPLEKEFRALALKEAKGNLTSEETNRLEALTFWRDKVSVQRTGEEIFLQIQRDRVVDKISEALEEYVEYQKTSRSAGRFS